MPDQHGAIITRPPHFPTMHTRDQAKHLAAFGLSEPQMCAILRCTIDELRTYYAEEIETGAMRINAQVQNAVLHKALYEGDLQAMKLWLINKAGWKAGDGGKLLPNQQSNGEPIEGSGDIPVSQRREIVAEVLRKATQMKRLNERVIDAEIVPANKTNGHGTNGNGAKHR